jgi:hypothetical protein
MADNLKTYSHTNGNSSMDNIGGALAYLTQTDSLKKELEEVKKENKIITGKFTATKKERDDLKNENKEL